MLSHNALVWKFSVGFSFHVYSHGSSGIIGLKLHLISEHDQSAAAPIKRPRQRPDNGQTEAVTFNTHAHLHYPRLVITHRLKVEAACFS